MTHPRHWIVSCIAAVFFVIAVALEAPAQLGRGGAARSARDSAPIDITGQWVSVVNEDWLWRMITPQKGDTASVPLNPAGRRTAESWDLAADRIQGRLCKAFGPPGLIRLPGRIRIRWEDDNTLLLEFDAGMQARRFHFGSPPAPGTRSLQGHSLAKWFRQPQNRGIFGRGGPLQGGSLEVVTTNLEAGYLRPNGVPYSERAVVKDFIDTFTLPEDGAWLIVTTVVEDPEYLTQEFIFSTQFRKETDSSRWNPRPCDIPEPLTPRAPPAR
jgi:hypothetical protein